MNDVIWVIALYEDVIHAFSPNVRCVAMSNVYANEKAREKSTAVNPYIAWWLRRMNITYIAINFTPTTYVFLNLVSLLDLNSVCTRVCSCT